MDVQEACSGFMILEENMAKDNEDIVIDWWLDFSFYNMKRKEYWKWIVLFWFQEQVYLMKAKQP